MTVDGRLEIICKSAIQSGRAAQLSGQSQRLGKSANRRRYYGFQDRNRGAAVLDHHTLSGPHAGHQAAEIAGCLGLRDVDQRHGKIIPQATFPPPQPGAPFMTMASSSA